MGLTAVRIVLPSSALALFYWNFVLNPVAAPPGPKTVVGTVAVDTARELAEQADTSFKAGRFAEAVTSLEALEQQTPSSPIVLGLLAQSYGHLGRWKDAAEHWERYLPVSPTQVEACPSLPQAYEAQGLADKAFDAYERCYTIEPTNPDLVYLLARAFERRGQIDRARELYEAGHKLVGPANADFGVALARLYLRDGKVGLAAGVISPVVREDADTLLVRAQIAIRQDRFADARTSLNRALAKNDKYADLHVVMAVLERAEGHREEARRQCARALELDPGNGDARAIITALGGAK